MAMIKTAISMSETIFEEASEAARDMNVSRSHLIVLALEDFLRKRENAKLLEQLNAAHGDDLDSGDRAFLDKGKRGLRDLLEDDEW